MASRATILAALLLCSFSSLIQADDGTTRHPVSTLYNSRLNTTFSINLPTDSDDVNFFLSSPLFSWFGVGFTSTMVGSKMLVFYSSADRKAVTVSPRQAIGQTEPVYDPDIGVVIANTNTRDGNFTVTGTCSGCRQWGANVTSGSFILAWGPDTDSLASNDNTARIKQHAGFGHFVMNLEQATGPGGTDMLSALGQTAASDGASMTGDLQADDSNHGGLAHGVVMALGTLVAAPIDIITAGALARWPVLHMITSTAVLAFILAGMGLGIQLSRLYVETQQYRTAHQILGLVAIVAMLLVGVGGVFYRVIVKSAAKRDQQPPEKSGILGKVHRWTGRIVWVIMLVNNGLGLKYADVSSTLIIGYSVLAAGVFILVCLIRWTIYCCGRMKSREEEEEDKAAIELAQLYAPNRQGFNG